MAQVKEQNPAQAQNNPNRNSESGGEKRTRTRRPYYNRRPRRPQQPREAAVPIHIYPLGGLGEVGKNMTVYECNGDMIIVDCGLAACGNIGIFFRLCHSDLQNNYSAGRPRLWEQPRCAWEAP